MYDNEGAAASASQNVTVAPATVIKAKAVSKKGKLARNSTWIPT